MRWILVLALWALGTASIFLVLSGALSDGTSASVPDDVFLWEHLTPLWRLSWTSALVLSAVLAAFTSGTLIAFPPRRAAHGSPWGTVLTWGFAVDVVAVGTLLALVYFAAEGGAPLGTTGGLYFASLVAVAVGVVIAITLFFLPKSRGAFTLLVVGFLAELTAVVSVYVLGSSQLSA